MTSTDLKQEIKDLFSRHGTGDYMPTPAEVEAIDDGLDNLVDEFLCPTNEAGELRALLRPHGDKLVLTFAERVGGVIMTRDQAIKVSDAILAWADAH